MTEIGEKAGDSPQASDDRMLGAIVLVDPEKWIGGTALWGGREWSIDGCAYAPSNLPSRSGNTTEDGTPVRVPLTHVYQLDLRSGNEHVIAFGCAYCGLLRERAGQVRAHHSTCSERSEIDRRPYIPQVVRSMTLGEIIDMGREVTRLRTRVVALTEELSGERRLRRAAERDINTIRNALRG